LLICQQRFLFNVFLTLLFFHKKRVFNGFLIHAWDELFYIFDRN